MAQSDIGRSKTRQAELDAAFEAVIADLQMDAVIEEAVDEIVPDENRRKRLKQSLGR
jgi:hypothetical protein